MHEHLVGLFVGIWRGNHSVHACLAEHLTAELSRGELAQLHLDVLLYVGHLVEAPTCAAPKNWQKQLKAAVKRVSSPTILPYSSIKPFFALHLRVRVAQVGGNLLERVERHSLGDLGAHRDRLESRANREGGEGEASRPEGTGSLSGPT